MKKKKQNIFEAAMSVFGKKSNGDWYQDNFSDAYFKTYFQNTDKAVWTPRNYEKFAEEGYAKNVVAYRSINLIAQAVSSVGLKVFKEDKNGQIEVLNHDILKLLKRPNPCCSGKEFLESIIIYRMINGNSFVMAVAPDNVTPRELHVLRPDRVSIIAGKGGLPSAYQYNTGERVQNVPVDRISGRSKMLHIKNFNPSNDWYGMSPIEAAAYSIDQHNQAGVWNQALLQNGAKPSGALVVKVNGDGSGGTLSEEQFSRIKNQVDEQYSGAANAGRPILLEGGLDWKEMSLSPKDMDFIESKNSSARDIALAFGVPPQLLGISGDNSYSNLIEARVALWEQTVLPLLDNVINSLNNWLAPMYKGEGLTIAYDTDSISALSHRREKVWKRIQEAEFMTVNEKRAAVGLSSVEGGDGI